MAARATTDIDLVYLGEDGVTAIYLGDQLVWTPGLGGMDYLFVPDEFEEG